MHADDVYEEGELSNIHSEHLSRYVLREASQTWWEFFCTEQLHFCSILLEWLCQTGDLAAQAQNEFLPSFHLPASTVPQRQLWSGLVFSFHAIYCQWLWTCVLQRDARQEDTRPPPNSWDSSNARASLRFCGQHTQLHALSKNELTGRIIAEMAKREGCMRQNSTDLRADCSATQDPICSVLHLLYSCIIFTWTGLLLILLTRATLDVAIP